VADSPIAKKLLIKPGHKVLLLNAPSGMDVALRPLPEGAVLSTTPRGEYDVVLTFVLTMADIDNGVPVAVKALKPGGLLWMAYQKKSAAKTDISRDVGWDAAHAAGLEGVSLVAVDETWSAMRFRPATVVKSRRRP
jgi:hypothetical protein